jgi:flagellar motor component MotA
MKMLVRYAFAMVVTILAIVIAVMIGENGHWYMAWVLGTGFMILVAAMGAVLLDQQDRDKEAGPKT